MAESWRPDLTVATEDHNVPTEPVNLSQTKSANKLKPSSNTGRVWHYQFSNGDPHQGIVHVIGPELGLTQG